MDGASPLSRRTLTKNPGQPGLFATRWREENSTVDDS